MNRRQMITTLGATGAMLLSTRALAQQHDHHAEHKTAMPKPSAGKFQPLLMSAADCVAKGQVCLAHCIELLAQGDKSMSDCAKSINQMLALCTALESLAAQNSSMVPAVAKLALEACEHCAETCEPHIAHHAECKACFEACKHCIDECKRVI